MIRMLCYHQRSVPRLLRIPHQHSLAYSGSCSRSDSSQEKKFVPFSVDRSGLMGKDAKSDYEGNEDGPLTIEGKEEPTDLAKDLFSYIKLKGPITVHDYMAQAANHSLYGYYQHKLEKIGTGGDFITAPEISQLFGEMVGIWCVSVWMALGKPEKMNLVEMGPGKGTLMQDVLKVAKRFPSFNSAIQVIETFSITTCLHARCDGMHDVTVCTMRCMISITIYVFFIYRYTWSSLVAQCGDCSMRS